MFMFLDEFLREYLNMKRNLIFTFFPWSLLILSLLILLTAILSTYLFYFKLKSWNRNFYLGVFVLIFLWSILLIILNHSYIEKVIIDKKVSIN